MNNTPAWIVAAMGSNTSTPSLPFKPPPPSTPCPFPPITAPKHKTDEKQVPPPEPEASDDVDDSVVEMGNESILYSRPKRKYEIIVSNGNSNRDEKIQHTEEASERYLRVPVPHRYAFKVGDHIAYRTLSLSEETWNPIISDIEEVR